MEAYKVLYVFMISVRQGTFAQFDERELDLLLERLNQAALPGI